MRGTSPIHRLSATGGLIALVPVAVLLFQDRLTLLEAGTRGVAILIAVLSLRWITDRTVHNLAARLTGAGSYPHIAASPGETGREGHPPTGPDHGADTLAGTTRANG